jgi:hypothetical protein
MFVQLILMTTLRWPMIRHWLTTGRTLFRTFGGRLGTALSVIITARFRMIFTEKAMLTMLDYAAIRQAYYVEGHSIRRIARDLDVSRQSVRKALEDAKPRPSVPVRLRAPHPSSAPIGSALRTC